MKEQEDKRIRRTKKLIRQALTTLMQKKEFQSITVTDIVREADINRGTFYAHYRDVYDLREKIESEMISDFKSMIDGFRPNTVDTSLRPVLVRALDYLEENSDVVTTLMRVSGEEGFGRKLIEIIEECRLATVSGPSLEDSYIGRFVSTGLVGLLEKWVKEEAPLTKDEMIHLMEKILSPLIYQT